jgi:hypothetical protein
MVGVVKEFNPMVGVVKEFNPMVGVVKEFARKIQNSKNNEGRTPATLHRRAHMHVSKCAHAKYATRGKCVTREQR